MRVRNKKWEQSFYNYIGTTYTATGDARSGSICYSIHPINMHKKANYELTSFSPSSILVTDILLNTLS
jgi:hypothetical protein